MIHAYTAQGYRKADGLPFADLEIRYGFSRFSLDGLLAGYNPQSIFGWFKKFLILKRAAQSDIQNYFLNVRHGQNIFVTKLSLHCGYNNLIVVLF